MSDLFKKNRPRLSEDEERALWERVRTIPREAGGRPVPTPDRRRSPWEILWARPAVRFGAPALAVALVAVLWVTQREPVAPARQEAQSRVTAPASPSPSPSMDAPQATAPTAPAEEEERRSVAQDEAAGRDVALPQSARERAAGTFATPPPAASPVPERAEAKEERVAVGATGAPATGGAAAGDATAQQKMRTTAKASPEAVSGFYREDPRTGTIRRADELQKDGDSRVAELRAARGSSTSATFLGDRILVEVLAPTRAGTFLETVSLPISGGVARIAVSASPGALWVEDGNVTDLVRIAGQEGASDAPTRRRVELSPDGTGGAAAIVAPDGRALESRFVSADGDARTLAGPRSTARSRAAALAADLILAVARGDASAVRRVDDAAQRLAADRPTDASAQALAAWSGDARTAFGDSR